MARLMVNSTALFWSLPAGLMSTEPLQPSASKVEGPIQGGEVVLKSHAHVVGDVHYQSLAIESGAFFDGRLVQVLGNGQTPEKLERKSLRQIANRESLSRRIERAVEADLGPTPQRDRRE